MSEHAWSDRRFVEQSERDRLAIRRMPFETPAVLSVHSLPTDPTGHIDNRLDRKLVSSLRNKRLGVGPVSEPTGELGIKFLIDTAALDPIESQATIGTEIVDRRHGVSHGLTPSGQGGEPDEDLGQRVHAIVEARPVVDEETLRAHLADQLLRYKAPRSFEFVDAPLRDEAGKLRRGALRAARLGTA